MKKVFYLLLLILLLLGCAGEQEDNFYQGFIDPPAEARPFVRWWWNGNHIEADEIKRELDSMKKAGIGGVEINPIAMPDEAKDIGTEPVKWLSEEWNELLALAAQEAQHRDMIADMIVGSGWPFGGEFLQPDDYTQRVMVNSIQVDAPADLDLSYNDLLDRMDADHSFQQAESNEVFFISLVPVNASDESQTIDLTDHYENKRLQYSVDRGSYELVYGIHQKGHRNVMHGALGASGNVMDHYSEEITREYLQRLKKISEDTGIPLEKLLRALFCDSIELAGANWTDGFLKTFRETYGYSLKPYLPFVFYNSHSGYEENDYTAEFRDELRRVRYDYNSLLTEVFLDNFTRTFQEFCTKNGLKCRYQAYGIPFHMDLLEGYKIPDIPESNNWLYSAEMDAPRWKWDKTHGYMIWNHYAAAGGHLKGRKIISCEAMTNTRGVFKASLEEIKQHDDMNFISGITHSVLHGYNYSPREAGFPGWVRYGAYFSPQNTWWPYFNHWVDYNARLSYVFQNSKPVKSVAVLGPTADDWSKKGLVRPYFHNHPWYLYELWQALSQNGSSCEYLNEQVIRNAEMKDGKLVYGPMQYETLWLGSVQSMHPKTAQAIQRFVEEGGTLMMIDSLPHRSLALQSAERNDSIVRTTFKILREDYPERVFWVNSPEEQDGLMEWTRNELDHTDISRDVRISNPDPGLYQIRQKKGERDIYFFTNTWRNKTLDFTADFPVEDKTPWVWDPESGERHVYPHSGSSSQMDITLKPLESLLLVFESGREGEKAPEKIKVDAEDYLETGNQWDLTFHHTNGEKFERTFNTLKEFTSTGDSLLQSFAGKVVYETTLQADGDHSLLKLNDVNEGVTEVYVNGEKAGVRWYGNHTYDLEPFIEEGENDLKIVYTTVLANYCSHLKDSPTAQRWTRGYSPVPQGIEGPVRLYGTMK